MEMIDILAFGVHPDDVELGCSGTLLKHIAMGFKVGLVDLTRGELGTRGTADIRTVEALNAMKKWVPNSDITWIWQMAFSG